MLIRFLPRWFSWQRCALRLFLWSVGGIGPLGTGAAEPANMQPKNKGVNQAPAVTQVTHVYKRVDGVEIKADVHRLDDRVVRPVVVWIHGGALMNGGRDRILRQMHQLVREGVVVVSIDYRLAPETKLPTKPPSRSSKSTSGCVSPDK